SSGNLKGQIENLKRENDKLKQELVAFQQIQSQAIKAQLLEQAVSLDDFHLVSGKVMDLDADQLKNLTYELGDQLKPAVVVLGNASSDKAQLMVYIDKELTGRLNLHAGNLIRSAAGLISGGGGGQPFFATAGGKNPDGLDKAIAHIREAVE